MNAGEQFTLVRHVLPEHVSLQMLTRFGHVVFEASGKWLHPLFSLEHFLVTHPQFLPSDHYLHDRIAGKAAAALTCRLGFVSVKADLISSLALELYRVRGVKAVYDKEIERIACQTETLLDTIDDIEQIYTIIENRRNLGKRNG